MTSITSLKFAVAYYYCDYSDLPTLDISTILGTIIKQLLETFIDIPEDVEGMISRCYRPSTKIPDHELLIVTLFLVIDLFHNVFIIIDGIDELGKEEQNVTLSVVKRLAQHKSTEVKMFVFSRREETYITKSLQSFRRIDLSTANTASDISCFIKGAVRSKIESEELTLHNPSLEHDIVRALLDGAQGM